MLVDNIISLVKKHKFVAIDIVENFLLFPGHHIQIFVLIVNVLYRYNILNIKYGKRYK